MERGRRRRVSLPTGGCSRPRVRVHCAPSFMRRLVSLALIVASASGSPASSWGQTDGRVDSREAARTLANRAADALAHGEYEQAQELLRQAYEQYPAPTIA